jgi:hypothetical protein
MKRRLGPTLSAVTLDCVAACPLQAYRLPAFHARFGLDLAT